jgi:predicted RNA-binding Zn ribbon-like protein
METSPHIATQRVVGGNLALDLLNTQNGPAGGAPEEDALRDYADLLEWSQRVGAINPAAADALLLQADRDPAAARAVLERTKVARTYLYELFNAIARGTAAPTASIERLQRDEADALAHGRLVATDGGYRWSWDADGTDLDLARPLWTTIHAAATLLTDGPLERVKGCASCRFHFLDESKNRSRRWCSMEDCGAQSKMRRYVARRASNRGAAQPASE